MLSVSTVAGTPSAENVCSIPMRRFSWRAFGKNSTWALPQWWQTMAKQAIRARSPPGRSTATKPQSIW